MKKSENAEIKTQRKHSAPQRFHGLTIKKIKNEV
jgi:hypothetical protein